VFDDREVAEQDVDAFAADLEPRAAVHQSAPRAGWMNSAVGRESSEVDGVAVIEAEVPVGAGVGDAECARAA
jgi:hypothetical protein